MSLYFAYGANLVRAAMAARCPNAVFVAPAMLAHHRFAIIRGGHGTVLRQRGMSVHGALWRLGRGDEAALDRYEEVAGGLYRRERRVVTCEGRAVDALIYVARAIAPGRPRLAYIAGIAAAGRELGFPADYLASFDAIARTASGVRPD